MASPLKELVESFPKKDMNWKNNTELKKTNLKRVSLRKPCNTYPKENLASILFMMKSSLKIWRQMKKLKTSVVIRHQEILLQYFWKISRKKIWELLELP